MKTEFTFDNKNAIRLSNNSVFDIDGFTCVCTSITVLNITDSQFAISVFSFCGYSWCVWYMSPIQSPGYYGSRSTNGNTSNYNNIANCYNFSVNRRFNNCRWSCNGNIIK